MRACRVARGRPRRACGRVDANLLEDWIPVPLRVGHARGAFLSLMCELLCEVPLCVCKEL